MVRQAHHECILSMSKDSPHPLPTGRQATLSHQREREKNASIITIYLSVPLPTLVLSLPADDKFSARWHLQSHSKSQEQMG